MSRRNRRNRQQDEQATAPEAPAVAPLAASPDVDELRALRERLERVEATQTEPWYPGQNIIAANRARLAENTRDGSATGACPACGVAGGERRRVGGSAPRGDGNGWSTAWWCVDCTAAIEPGWGTNMHRVADRGPGMERLACSAAGMIEPTPEFLRLAARYGMTFRLAQDSGGGDGTPWGHLGRAAWLELGVKAQRRAAAGFGVVPVAQLLDAWHVEYVTGYVLDPSHPLGRRTGSVPKPVEPLSDAERAEQLRQEEAAIDAALKAQAQDRTRAEKEEAARAEQARQEEEVQAHYREHVARLDAQIRDARQALRADRDKVLSRLDNGGL